LNLRKAAFHSYPNSWMVYHGKSYENPMNMDEI
jgi:hypothetical protein